MGVVLFNLSDKDYQIKRGDRIAQLILEQIFTPPIMELEVCVTKPEIVFVLGMCCTSDWICTCTVLW